MNARLTPQVLNRSFSTNSTGGDKNFHNRIHKSNNAILVEAMKNSQYPSQRNFSNETSKVQTNGKSGVGDSMKPTAISKSTVQPILNLITKLPPSPQSTIGEIVARRGNNGEISALVSGGLGQYTHPFFSLPETVHHIYKRYFNGHCHFYISRLDPSKNLQVLDAHRASTGSVCLSKIPE